jgi:hypothetical protein
MSPSWIETARHEFTKALATQQLDDDPFTLSEEFTDPPAHLRRNGRLRIEGDPSRMPPALQQLDIHGLLAAHTL